MKIKIGKHTFDYSIWTLVFAGLTLLSVLLTLIGVVVKHLGSEEKENPVTIKEITQTEEPIPVDSSSLYSFFLDPSTDAEKEGLVGSVASVYEKTRDNSRTYISEYEFDTAGSIINSTMKTLAFPPKKEYNEYGLISSLIHYNQGEFSPGDRLSEIRYYYNLSLKSVRQETYGEYGGLNGTETTYYTEDRVINRTDRVDVNRHKWRESFTYDTLGNLITTYHIDGNFGDTIGTSHYSYTFDRSGNWTKKIEKGPSGYKTTTRSIRYH